MGHKYLYTYSATGEKLRVVTVTNANAHLVPVTTTDEADLSNALYTYDTTDYCDPYIYRNGRLDRLLTGDGYLTFDASGNAIRHHYVKDYLGSNRVVLNEEGTVEQVNHYYPLGMEFNEKNYVSIQPYKFGGLEWQPMHGLNLHDNHARQHDPATGRFTGVDALAESDCSVSPYAYCRNNPIGMVDPTGMQPFTFRVDNTSAPYSLYSDNCMPTLGRWMNTLFGNRNFGGGGGSRAGYAGGGYAGGGWEESSTGWSTADPNSIAQLHEMLVIASYGFPGCGLHTCPGKCGGD